MNSKAEPEFLITFKAATMEPAPTLRRRGRWRSC